MLYILDANTLIDAKRDYYPFDAVPEFWTWLVHQGEEGVIKCPVEVWEEFSDTTNRDGERDALAEWAAQTDVENALLLDEEVDPDLVKRITYGGYVANPTDDQLITIGRDPFLIAYGLADLQRRTIVTTEVSKPSKRAQNRKVPDVCNDFEVRCISTFELIRELKFSTRWSAQ